MGAAEVEAFLTYLATQRQVSSSTQNQALSAILFYIARYWQSLCRGLIILATHLSRDSLNWIAINNIQGCPGKIPDHDTYQGGQFSTRFYTRCVNSNFQYSGVIMNIKNRLAILEASMSECQYYRNLSLYFLHAQTVTRQYSYKLRTIRAQYLILSVNSLEKKPL